MQATTVWIARAEALDRLGVKPQTLYAYVSRGRIASRPDPLDSRRSLYAEGDIARLSGAVEPGLVTPAPGLRAPLRGEVEVRSALTEVRDGRLFYRGRDAVQLSVSGTLEDAARRLWDAGERNPFSGLTPRIDAVLGSSSRARLMAALARRAVEGLAEGDRPAEVLVQEAASVLDEAIDAVAGGGPRLFLHQRLARAWKASERDAHLLRRALVLSADAGLDDAVLATRAAAGGGAALAGAALAGVSTLMGSPAAREIAAASDYVIAARRDPAAALARPAAASFGFGSPDFPAGDPRAAALIEAAELPDDLARVVQAGEAATGRPANLALALALTARRLDLPREAGADLLILGRVTGLLGHAIDQTLGAAPLRARMRYVGPDSGAN